MPFKKKIDKELIARDAFFRWKVRAKSAKTSVTIFSPYLDRIARFVLVAADRLPADKRVVVTCISAETLLQQPSQLRELKHLLGNGHPVLHLDGLHAKVLLIDDTSVSIGSQNFTSRGRKNKETTGLPNAPINDSILAATLIDWREAATPVDEEYIDELIAMLGPAIRRHCRLMKETQAVIDDSLRVWRNAKEEREREEREREERKRRLHEEEERRRRAGAEQEEQERQRKELEARLARIAKKSTIQLRARIVYAKLKEVGWDSTYTSFVVWGAHSLISWQKLGTGGARKAYDLNRLNMYPAFFSDSGRMAFVRLAKSRITYARSFVSWTPPLQLEGVGRVTTVQLPNDDLARKNVEITLEGAFAGACKIQLKLVGNELHLTNVVADTRRAGSAELASKLSAHLGSPHAVLDLAERALSDFRFATLGRDNPNMSDFVDAGVYYRIQIFQLGKSPVLWVAKHT